MKTLHDILDELQDYRRGLNFSNQTERTFRNLAEFFIRFLEENYRVTTADRIRAEHLRRYQKFLSTLTGKKGLPLKPGSINNRICAVHTLLEFMYRRSFVATNLKRHISTVKTPKLLPTSVLTHAQVRKLLRTIDTTTKRGYRNRTIIEVLYSTGIRGGELVTLTLDNVDLENATLKVFGKGKKERIVPIGKTALKWLTSYIRGIRPFQLGSGRYREVFLSKKGFPLSQSQIQTLVPYYAEKANIDVRVTPHTFRRSCATEMIRGDANIYHVKDLLGHESIETLKPYTKLTITDIRKTHAKCHPREKDEI